MADHPLTGRCACGAVRFHLSAPLLDAGYCHCTRCQHRSGTAASINAGITPGSLSIDAGTELIAAWSPAGGGNDKLFCSGCGSALFGRPPGADTPGSVRVGALDGDPGVVPSYRQFVSYAAVWEPIPEDGLPRFAERRPLP